MITFKDWYDGSLVMSKQTQAQEATSHFPAARLVTIGHFQSEQSLVVVAQWEEHALSVSPIISDIESSCSDPRNLYGFLKKISLISVYNLYVLFTMNIFWKISPWRFF